MSGDETPIAHPRSEGEAPELLAPAGGAAALRAAVRNGCDAVYLGVDRLNARRGAENFELDRLGEVCRYAHLRDVRVYLTANVLVLPEELPDALDLVRRAWEAGVDAVILQDLGLLRAVRRELPGVRVHASTQMNTHDSRTLAALAGLGTARVTLARETSLDEIAELSAAADVETESFVHGALCVCYSGQCLMSSMIGGRSANRGLCAQPCRLPYELIDERGSAVEAPGRYLLSPKDLAGLNRLPELIATGVSALKIEGRMKSPEYVALVTGVYRSALDRAWADPAVFVERTGEREVLEEAFNRGFTEAYMAGVCGDELMSYRRPNNRGVPLGRVINADGGTATLALERDLAADDTVEFWTRSGRFAQRAGDLEIGFGQTASRADAGARVGIRVEHPVAAGDRAFRVANASLLAAARRSFADESGTRPIKARVRMVIGQPLVVEFTDDAGRIGAAEGDRVEAARTKVITAEEIVEHVGRIGDTPYMIDGWDIELSPGAGISYSALHRVRRAAIEDLEREILALWPGRADTATDAARVRDVVPAGESRRAGSVTVAVATFDLQVAHECLRAGADEAHVPLGYLPTSEALLPGIVPVFPRVMHDAEWEHARGFLPPGARIAAGTLGALAAAAESGALADAHWSLNLTNPEAVALVADLGASRAWLSPELTAAQIGMIAAGSGVPCGVAVLGRQELMVTEHCVLSAARTCARECASCERRSRRWALRDRKGYEFPVVVDPAGRTHLFNAVPLDVTEHVASLVKAGIELVRIDVVDESPREAARMVTRVRDALNGRRAIPDAKGADGRRRRTGAGESTAGHLFRGVR